MNNRNNNKRHNTYDLFLSCSLLFALGSVCSLSGNIFIMMPTGPKDLQCYVDNLCMPEMINVSTFANLLTSVRSGTFCI